MPCCLHYFEVYSRYLASHDSLLFDAYAMGLCSQGSSNDEMEIMFQFQRYWELQHKHNWSMQNAFIFDGKHGIKGYITRLKGILLWQYWLLYMGIVSITGYSTFMMTLANALYLCREDNMFVVGFLHTISS